MPQCHSRENFLTGASMLGRWWRRKIPELTSSHAHTESTATYGTIPSEKDLKTSCAAASHIQTRKESHRGRLSRGIAINPTPGQRPTIGRELTNPERPPEERGVHTPTSAPQHLRPALERWASKTSGFEKQRGSHPWDPKRCSELRNASLRAHTHSPGSSSEAAVWEAPRLYVKEFICKY